MKVAAVAHFADGSSRDVTHLAVFEPTVAGAVNVAPDGTVTRLRSAELNVIVRYLDRQEPVTLAFLPARANFTWADVALSNPIDKHLFAAAQRHCD